MPEPETTKAPAGPPVTTLPLPSPKPDDDDEDTDTEQKRKPRRVDPEVKSLDGLVAILDRHDEPARRNMVRYLNGRYYPDGA